MNDLATLSFQGYRELKARSAEEQQAARRRLLQLILNRDDPVPLRALADLADTACWPLPDEVAAVAVTPAPPASGPGGAAAEPLAEAQPRSPSPTTMSSRTSMIRSRICCCRESRPASAGPRSRPGWTGAAPQSG